MASSGRRSGPDPIASCRSRRVAPSIIPRDFEFYWPAPAYAHDPARAKQLLAEAGYPKGFDAVEVATDVVFAPEAETVINGLQAIGIRARLRPMERASFYKADQERRFQELPPGGGGGPPAAAAPDGGVRMLRPGSSL